MKNGRLSLIKCIAIPGIILFTLFNSSVSGAGTGLRVFAYAAGLISCTIISACYFLELLLDQQRTGFSDLKGMYTNTWRQYKGLAGRATVLFIVCLLFSYIFQTGYKAELIWAGLVWRILINAAANCLCIAGIGPLKFYHGSWAVLTMATALIVLSPLVLKAASRSAGLTGIIGRVCRKAEGGGEVRTPFAKAIYVLVDSALEIWLFSFIFVSSFSDRLYGSANKLISYLVTLIAVCAVGVLVRQLTRPHIWEWLSKVTEKRGRLLLLSAALSLFMVVLVRFTTGISWLTNDDVSIANALAGANTGTPSFYHQFTGVIPAVFISALYSALPALNWWFIYTLVMLIGGMTMVHYVLFLGFRLKGFGARTALAAAAVLDLGFSFYNIEMLSFTVVPAIFTAGCLSLIVGAAEGWVEGRKRLWVWLAVAFVLMYSHRADTSRSCTVFFLMGIFFFVIKKHQEKGTYRRAVFFAAFILAGVFVVEGTNSYAKKAVNGAEFVSFNSARVDYQDYPHDSYADNPGLYEEIGWDYNLSALASAWYFMDERVTAENLEYIVENSESESTDFVLDTLKYAWDMDSIRFIYIIWLVCSLAALLTAVLGRNTAEAFVQVCNVGGSHILLLYLAYTGRMPYRAVAVILIPSMVFGLLMYSLPNDCEEVGNGHSRINKCVVETAVVKTMMRAAFAVSLMVAAAGVVADAADEETVSKRRAQIAAYSQMCSYADDHSENLYIRMSGISGNLKAGLFMSYSSGNNLSWGGSSWGSAVTKKHWEINGISEPTQELFLEDDTYLVFDGDLTAGASGNEDFLVFYDYLDDLYGVTGFVQNQMADGIWAYRFIFDDSYEGGYYYLTEDWQCIYVEG